MPETLTGEVLHVIPPDDLDDAEVEPELEALAASRYILICRKGGAPSLFEFVWSVLRRRPIEAVTIVADAAAEEGAELRFTVETTELEGVYRAVSPPTQPE